MIPSPLSLIQEAAAIDYSQLTERQAAEIIEGIKAYRDEYNSHVEEVLDNKKPADPRIITRVNNGAKLSRFSSIDALADWIVGGWQK